MTAQAVRMAHPTPEAPQTQIYLTTHRSGAFLVPRFNEIAGSQVGRGAGAFGNRKSNVVHAQAVYLARSTTKAPETRIYFITHGSGAFPVPRVRTVVRGERASRSIVNRTTVLWSIWMVPSLILAGLG